MKYLNMFCFRKNLNNITGPIWWMANLCRYFSLKQTWGYIWVNWLKSFDPILRKLVITVFSKFSDRKHERKIKIVEICPITNLISYNLKSESVMNFFLDENKTPNVRSAFICFVKMKMTFLQGNFVFSYGTTNPEWNLQFSL